MVDCLEFMKRACSEGRIVSSNDLTTLQITEAQACKRFYVDPVSHLGWAILPWCFSTPKDRVRELEDADTEMSRAGIALAERVRELERIIEESVVSGSELVVGQYILIREKLAYDEFGYTATAINGEHRPTSLEPKLDLWEAADQARRWSMVPPPDIHAAKGLADGN